MSIAKVESVRLSVFALLAIDCGCVTGAVLFWADTAAIAAAMALDLA